MQCLRVFQCGNPMPLEDVPQGYTNRLDTAFSVQNIVEELHYQHPYEAERTGRTDMSGRAEPLVEQGDGGGSDDYYLKRGGGGGGAEGGVAVSLRGGTAPLACGSWRACV